MNSHSISAPALAVAITRAASRHTDCTIHCLADRALAHDAYRAYAYFRWLDDWLDQETRPRTERLAFVQRQQALMESCSHRQLPDGLAPEERLLADLILRDTDKTSGLQAYLRNMMAVMAFDADRRGRLVSQRELNDYTRWLAVAVTEALHHFIGHDCASPQGELRYQAVTGAHITHMLRDTLDDVKAGYYNIPQEVVNAHDVAPWEVESQAYRDWVQERVRKARTCFRLGRDYLAQVESLRCRIAGYAYVHHFEAVLDCIEREGYVLRARYPERTGWGHEMETIGWALWMAFNYRRPAYASSILPVR